MKCCWSIPGGRASHVVTLVQEVTRRSTADCATLVHDAPSRIAGFSNRKAAEDLVARFREFDAVAIVRRPGEKGVPAAPPPSVVPRPRVPIAHRVDRAGHRAGGGGDRVVDQPPAPGSRPELLGVGGLILGVVAVVAGIWKLRRDDLD